MPVLVFVTRTAIFRGDEWVLLEVVANMMWSCIHREIIEFEAPMFVSNPHRRVGCSARQR